MGSSLGPRSERRCYVYEGAWLILWLTFRSAVFFRWLEIPRFLREQNSRKLSPSSWGGTLRPFRTPKDVATAQSPGDLRCASSGLAHNLTQLPPPDTESR